MILKDKQIVVGVTGGIAAYKVPEIIRLLKKNGAKVQVVMTPAATEFITPLTLQTISGRDVYFDLFNQNLSTTIDHINLARWPDAILIAPATANTISKMACGIADNLLTTICLSTENPLVIAPAMNKEMWANNIVQSNVKKLFDHDVVFLGPDSGWQACNEEGLGRMLSPQDIVDGMISVFTPKVLLGKKIVVTAGPTIEPIDPVRYISNHSSGKMGYAIASAAANAGGLVTLISGSTNLQKPKNIKKCVDVMTAKEMHKHAIAEAKKADIFISVAAVMDWRPGEFSNQKIKKQKFKPNLSLSANPDILADVAALSNPPKTVGFALETNNIEKNAKQKLKAKNIDVIAANSPSKQTGPNSDLNELFIFTKEGKEIHLPLQSKQSLAQELIKIIQT